MAPYLVFLGLFLTLALARTEAASTNPVVKGSVTCLDCDAQNDLSGIKVLVKCSNVKKLAMATTKEDGSFQTELPMDTQTPPDSLECLARILGGPSLLYSSKQKSDSRIVKVNGNDYHTNSQPLSFYKSCPPQKYAKCASIDKEFGSSKTVDLPVPPQWGLAPSSYYLPFIPIIGIP